MRQPADLPGYLPEDMTDGPIAVAISGGADSLYTLLSLKKKGAELIGVHGLFGQNVLNRFMKHAGLPPLSPTPEILAEKLQDICDDLGVPFHLINCENLFMEQVIKPFILTYAQGGTPNPCALCNATVKLGDLLRQSMDLGAKYLATGHYARHVRTSSGPVLLQGDDPLKDQSYFLSLTPAGQLEHILFPVGGRRKKDILDELASWNIIPPQRNESQEICFIPGNLYREFLPFMAAELGITLPGSGKVCLEDGTCLGTHNGLWQFTEGQRKGIGIGWKEPLHVLTKEMDSNILRVGSKNSLHTASFTCDTSNILVPYENWPETVLVKARYREQPQAAHVRLVQQGDTSSMHITYTVPYATVSCGQLATVYIPYEKNPNHPLCVAAGGIITHTSQ